MRLRYNFRLYPTAGQRATLARTFGCARVVYNDGLRMRQDAHAAGLPYISDAELSKRVITEAKKTPERAWLGEVSAVVLQQALADLNTAYRNFFSSITGERKGPKVAPPRLRSRKDNRQAVRFTRNARFSISAGGKLRLPKIGNVPVRWSRKLPAEPSSVTVIKDADGRKIDSPRFLRRTERRLRKAQKALSRKQKGSANRAKARARLAKAHAEVTDARRDFAHKLSTTLIRENQAVYVEDLAVKSLARTPVAKSVHDAGWSQFVAMLEYKAARYGRTFGRIDRWFPSSKLCSVCGAPRESMPLKVRGWACPCGAVHDRDVNAAKNILAAGRADRLNACGGLVRPPLAVARPGETGTHRGTA
ncbi:MAG TPA: transposase [Micromonosporaceae bacterium]